MKSVKAKLFTGFVSVIFIILIILSIISIKLFSFNQEKELFQQIDDTLEKVIVFIKNSSDLSIVNINKDIELKKQFLIIVKNERVIFSSETNYKTDLILEEAYDEYEDYKDDDRNERKAKREDGFIIYYDLIEKNDSEYEIFTGIDEELLDFQTDDIVFAIILFNIIIFIILLALGYLLINKTIKPLKLILEELEELQTSNDLSKRLKQIQTKDEFEQVVNSFNTLLNNIENSVENIKQFSSDASHELKTPLTVIQGEIELLKNKDATKEELDKVIKKVDFEQKKLQSIIKDFILLSKLDKEILKNEKASLDKLILENIEVHLERLEEKSLELKLDLDEDLEVNFNEKYLNIVISNLITNAIKYTNEGFIKINAKKDKAHIYFEICDSGIGINKEDYAKIFERFYRVDKVRSSFEEGSGLGLSIVKKLCERFHSKITMKSEENKGSCFKVEFQD